MHKVKELFSIQKGDNWLTVAVTGRGRTRRYLGTINDRIEVVSREKGDALRLLIERISIKAANDNVEQAT